MEKYKRRFKENSESMHVQKEKMSDGSYVFNILISDGYSTISIPLSGDERKAHNTMKDLLKFFKVNTIFSPKI